LNFFSEEWHIAYLSAYNSSSGGAGHRMNNSVANGAFYLDGPASSTVRLAPIVVAQVVFQRNVGSPTASGIQLLTNTTEEFASCQVVMSVSELLLQAASNLI
jgi:hypothetical protein